jgi:cytochrome c oxidase assembly protein subunit 15
MMSSRSLFYLIARIATVLALCVVVLGAYVRLTDAGLGCPDWPGCYGQIVVPASPAQTAAAEAAYPDRPLEAGKAWREMIHRYLASTLGLLIVALAVIAWRRRREVDQPKLLPFLLLVLVVFQGLLGMWTVTLLLKPLIVMGHLLGGLATLSLLFVLARSENRQPASRPLAGIALAGLIVLVGQLALGGWTSTNYAALACPDFPTCQTQWWPQNMDFREAFVMWRGLGRNYEGGVLDNPARTAIHMTHRLGAIVVTLTLGLLAWFAWRSGYSETRRAAIFMAAALLLQLSLGVSIVLLQLPLALATAHNAGAALLLLSVVNLNIVSRTRPTHAPS